MLTIEELDLLLTLVETHLYNYENRFNKLVDNDHHIWETMHEKLKDMMEVPYVND